MIVYIVYIKLNDCKHGVDMQKNIFVFFLILLNYSLVGLDWSDYEFLDQNSKGNACLKPRDLNNDGRKDIIGAAIEDNCIQIWWNFETGWEKEKIPYNLPYAHSVDAADIDNDGDVDLVGTSYGSKIVVFYFNENGVRWLPKVITTDFTQAHEVELRDLNGDRYPDILGAASEGNQFAVWYNPKARDSDWQKLILPGGFSLPKSITAADVNNDSKPEIFGASLLNSRLYMWENIDNDSTSWKERIIDSNFPWAHKLVIEDIDSDGKPDILGAGYKGCLKWWKNLSSAGKVDFSQAKTIALGFTNACVAKAADLDSDGDFDIVATAQGANKVSWFENKGDNSLVWMEHPVDTGINRPWPVALGDFDSDGDVDIVSGTSHEIPEKEVKVYYNSKIVSINENSLLGKESLADIFPVPANPGINIKFTLEKRSQVNLEIYNCKGQKLKTYDLGIFSSGINPEFLNLSSYQSGVYLLKIKTEHYIEYKKFQVLK